MRAAKKQKPREKDAVAAAIAKAEARRHARALNLTAEKVELLIQNGSIPSKHAASCLRTTMGTVRDAAGVLDQFDPALIDEAD